MIFSLRTTTGNTDSTKGFYIATDSEIATYNAESSVSIVSSGNFVQYERTYQRITKEYRNLNGNVITYGVRSRYETIGFTIECIESDYQHIMDVLKSDYEYSVVEQYPNFPITMRLSGDLKEAKICNDYLNGEPLYTISGTLVEV